MRKFSFPDLAEFQIFKTLTTPAKTQDFLNSFPINFEPEGETCRSPLQTLRHGTAHCFEGAVLAAAIFWYHGRPPFLIDLETGTHDESHVIAPFREGMHWGAVSKTNHAVLRYRDPVYASVRELVMSYFHEYFLDTGEKTLRAYSRNPLNLLEFDDDWLIAEHPLWGVHDNLVAAPHEKIAPHALRLRPADSIEIRAGTLTEWKRPRR
ncbi:hypothetical protein HY416_03820 [Candidatus Kaiserbacteria bacterium]|nr:hypothetical protein [Candidatus Kaiserbacteria bacterium]